MTSFLKRYVSLVFHVLFDLNNMKARKMHPLLVRKNFLIGCALCVLFRTYTRDIYEISQENLRLNLFREKERGEG